VALCSAVLITFDPKELPYLCCANRATEIGSDTQTHFIIENIQKKGTLIVLTFDKKCLRTAQKVIKGLCL